MTIAVRNLTTADEVFANAKRLKGVFFGSRRIAPTQVPTTAKHTANQPLVAASTPEPQMGSGSTSGDVAALSAEVEILRRIVAHLTRELDAIKFVQAAADLIEEEEGPRRISMALIRSYVIAEFKVSRLDLESARKSNRVVHPRNALMWLIRKNTTKSYPEIGNFLGDKHHTTVMHGCDRAEELMAVNPSYRAKIEAIQSRIENGESLQ